MNNFVGSKPCETCLNKALIEANDPKITSHSMRRINYLKETYKKLDSIKSEEFGLFKKIALLIHDDLVKKFDVENRMPTIVKTLTLCCLKGIYREAIKTS